MKTSTTKKYIIYISGVITLIQIIVDQIGTFQICSGFEYKRSCAGTLHDSILLLIPIIPIFLFSLITYKMKDEVFTSWFNFAKWWVPVIILVTYLQSLQSGGGGLGIGGALSSGFDLLVLGFFYFIFVLGSLIIIVKKYRATR